MNLLALLIKIFGFGQATAEAVTATADPEEVKVSKHEIKKPRLETGELMRRQQKIFNKIKNVPDADVKSFVLEWTDMNEEDTEVMTRNIEIRIAEYRRNFPIISGWKRFIKKGK